MRICYIANASSPHIIRWIKEFQFRGHEIHSISDYHPKQEIEGVTYHILDRGKHIKAILETRKIIKEINPDVIHAFFTFAYGFYGVLSGSKPVILTPLGSDITHDVERSKIIRLFTIYTLRKADLVCSLEKSSLGRVRYLSRKAKTMIIPWGIDTEMFKPVLSKSIYPIKILYLRKSMPSYNPEVLLETIPLVVAEYPNVIFQVLDDGSEIDKLKSVMKDSKNIEYIKPVDYSEMPNLINSCDIYVDTGYSKYPGCGIGMTTQEAMSCGKPVVITDIGGFEDYIDKGKNGLIYPHGNALEFASQIKRLIKDSGLRDKIGRNARQYMVKNQNWESNMNKMEALYMRVTK